MALPDSWLSPLPTPSSSHAATASERQNTLTKPPGSLGQLEQLAITLCGQQHTDQPSADRVHMAIFAGDHGVCDEGISAFPQAVTAQMIANFAGGGAAISVMARQLGAALEVVNLGTVGDVAESLPGVIDARIRPGTRNFALEPAMTTSEVATALRAGDAAAERARQAGANLFIAGDMGIGNTTSASAMACQLLGQPPESLTGPGTGLNAEGVRRKAAVIAKSLARHGSDTTPLAVLASLGGLEIAAITSAVLGAASRGIPVLVDGFIVSVAALVACKQQPELRHWLHFAHHSAEPGHNAVLQALNAQPLLNLGMRLGEGSGAAVAVPLLRAACALHNQMASFASAGVSDQSGD